MDNKKILEVLALVKNNYQEIAVEFDVTRKKEIWPEIREYVEKINNDAAVLDVGCGNGRLIEAFKEKKIKYCGVDNSAELIKIAQKNYPEQKFTISDILDLHNIENDYYDKIFCLATLQHIPSKELRVKALQKMAEKLKKGGTVIISNWNLWSKPKYYKQLIKNNFRKVIGLNKLDFNDIIFPWKNTQGQEMSLRYYHAFTKRELRKIARLAKLQILEVKRDKYNFWLVLNKK